MMYLSDIVLGSVNKLFDIWENCGDCFFYIIVNLWILVFNCLEMVSVFSWVVVKVVLVCFCFDDGVELIWIFLEIVW